MLIPLIPNAHQLLEHDPALEENLKQLQEAIAEATSTRRISQLADLLEESTNRFDGYLETNPLSPVAVSLLKELEAEASQVCTFTYICCMLDTYQCALCNLTRMHGPRCGRGPKKLKKWTKWFVSMCDFI